MNVAFYINTPALAELIQAPGFNYPAFCFSLLEGDYKNDKIPRCVQLVSSSNDEARLVNTLKSHTETGRQIADVFYVVGMTSKYSEIIRLHKSRNMFKLFIVNAPSQRHPASLVAFADGVKRIKAHHRHVSCSSLSSRECSHIEIFFKPDFSVA